MCIGDPTQLHRHMETYYLSYNPNDFYWVSVSGDYDLTVCEDMIRPKTRRVDTKLGIHRNGKLASESECPCCTSTPEPTTPSLQHAIQDTHIFKRNQYTDDPFYYQLCANYVYSNDLKGLQMGASERDQLHMDGQDKYFTNVLQITNICLGLAAMALVVRS
jgi:hypothetical protein